MHVWPVAQARPSNTNGTCLADVQQGGEPGRKGKSSRQAEAQDNESALEQLEEAFEKMKAFEERAGSMSREDRVHCASSLMEQIMALAGVDDDEGSCTSSSDGEDLDVDLVSVNCQIVIFIVGQGSTRCLRYPTSVILTYNMQKAVRRIVRMPH
eukprot:TRINITY_DN21904_c0_g1_i1.p1 TRINITY_DN21904_c0_g1~~TRINITY_DN21904_c0_g1_i1.p1  ORF type:complete len:154 (-),score=10.69 TRINITY_DN21904_c0_g1_i1:59-520(-)